jgi:hypothetical protein
MFPNPIIINTYQLREPGALDLYKNMGYTYIRQVHKTYDMILRYPSVGCIVQLLSWRDIGTHPIDSPRSRKLVNRICYFGYL